MQGLMVWELSMGKIDTFLGFPGVPGCHTQLQRHRPELPPLELLPLLPELYTHPTDQEGKDHTLFILPLAFLLLFRADCTLGQLADALHILVELITRVTRAGPIQQTIFITLR
jgi:hypothetical protein